MKKGMFFVLLAIMAIVCSCDREPVYRYTYIQQHGLDKMIADSLAGTYEGKLRVVMLDGSEEKFQGENGTWWRVGYEDSILNYEFMVGGYYDRKISYPDFPISWVANCIKDKALKEAFAKLPNTNIQGDYKIKGDPTPEIHTAYINFNWHPVVLSFEMNGEEHIAEFRFDDRTIYVIDADDKDTWCLPNIGLDLSQLKIDGKENNLFSQWSNNDAEEFFTWISHINKVSEYGEITIQKKQTNLK